MTSLVLHLVLFEEFRSSVFEILSAIAVSFYHQTKDQKVISVCYSEFGRVGKAVDVEILQPIILHVKREIEEFKRNSIQTQM